MGAGEAAIQEAAGESFLIFWRIARGERTALPAGLWVERIESVSLERIEYAGGRPMLPSTAASCFR